MNVLLIEPDELTARLLSKNLAQEGHTVERVSSGQQAIDVLDSAKIDCIILEPQLGVHNGIEFLYELRSYSEWQHIPVVVWTMNRTLLAARFAKAWRELAVAAVLYKPDEPLSQLTEIIDNQVTHQPA